MIPLFKVFMPESVMAPLKETLMGGYIGQGPKVAEFEKALVPWLGSRNVLAVNSGTSAIQLALRLANVGPGDEVISTPVTCTATNMPILAVGAKVVWADINPWTGNIDPESVKKKVTSKTKAVICVDWGGYPCDLYGLNRICEDHDLRLIEDAAHAFGAFYYGKFVGSYSDYVCFSFQAIKEITTVDGGALVCNRTQDYGRRRDDYDRGKLLRWYGINREAMGKDLRCEANIKEWGYKYHMNDVAATIGLAQIKHLDAHFRTTDDHAKRYRECLGELLLKYDSADHVSSYWLFTIRVKNRDEFAEKMTEAGIMVSKVHARNDLHTCFAESKVDLPGVDEFDAEQISIPVGWWLTDENVQYIIDTVRNLTNVNAKCGSIQCAS